MDKNAPGTWTGTWINEYGSCLHITEDRTGHIEGTFATALGDSSFAGTTVPIVGLSKGNVLHFAFATSQLPASIASFTGLLRQDTLHMAWHVVSDRAIRRPHPDADPTEVELPWPHAVLSNTDAFHRHP